MDDLENQGPGGGGGGEGGGKRRRRRRRRRRGGGEEGGQPATAMNTGGEWSEDILVTEHNGDTQGDDDGRRGRRARQPRRTSVDFSGPRSERESSPGGGRGEFAGPAVNVPSSGKNPARKRSSRARRAPPGSAAGRRRRLTRSEVEGLAVTLGRMPDAIVSNLYRGLGGQPGRVATKDRMIQLAVRAIAQGTRLGQLLKSLHERDRQAIAALLQAGGVAHNDEFHRELSLSLGGHDREWSRTMHTLAERGLVVASAEQDSQYFYVVPEILVDGLLAELGDELKLPTFESDEVRVLDHRPFCPPLDFSITTLATYIDLHHPRLTQRHEIHRHDQEEMDKFFGQLWEGESELFSFHIDFLMMHGMVSLRGDFLALNRDVMEEWLQLEPEDQRDLVFKSLSKRFPLAEWVLWAVHEAKGAWVAERPLMALYRRWKRGEDWRERLTRGVVQSGRTNERESFSFSQLVRIGLLDMGQWGQEKFYRLSPRGMQLLEPPDDEGFRQFYLTPSYEVMAPAGLAPVLLFRIGEMAELTGCDRANTYKITETSIAQALDRGWRRDDILQFLRDNSQIGVPDNVEQTLKGWIGHRGDVEFHELYLMTVHRSQIRRLEGNRKVKPYLLHRFAPGMYAVDRNRLAEIHDALRDSGFDPSKDIRQYPGDPEQVEARMALHKLVAEAREEAIDPTQRGGDTLQPEKFVPVPGTRAATMTPTEEEPEDTSVVTPVDIRAVLDKAMSDSADVEMVYLAKNGQRLTCRVHPERLAFKADEPVLVGLDRDANERRSFLLGRVERVKRLDS